MKLSGKLPEGDEDYGLGALDKPMVADPSDMHLVIAVVDCARLTTDVDSGWTEPTARVVRAEVVLPSDELVVTAAMDAARRARRGQLEISTGELA